MTFLDFKNAIYRNIGKSSSDTVAAAVIVDAINFAVLIASLIFQPKELQTSTTLSITSGANSASLSAISWADILRIYNTSDSTEMHFIPFEQWVTLVPSTTTLKYYTIHGTNLYVKQTPTADKSLTMYYATFPATLSSDTSSPEFSNYDSFILSTATAISFAAFEESDSANMWMTIQQMLSGPYKLSQAAKETISGRFSAIEGKFFQGGA